MTATHPLFACTLLGLALALPAHASGTQHFNVSLPRVLAGLSVELDLPTDADGYWKQILNNSDTTIAEFLHTHDTLASIDIEVAEVADFFDTSTLTTPVNAANFLHSPDVVAQLKQRYNSHPSADPQASRSLSHFQTTQLSGKPALRFQVQSQYVSPELEMRVVGQADYVAFMHGQRYVYIKMADEGLVEGADAMTQPYRFASKQVRFYDYNSSLNSIQLKY